MGRRFSTLLLGFALWGCSSTPLSQPETGTKTTKILDEVHVSSRADAEYFQGVNTQIDFGSAAVSAATLRVALSSPCFPFETWDSEQIPPGHNWPKLCDAFDRLIAAHSSVRRLPLCTTDRNMRENHPLIAG